MAMSCTACATHFCFLCLETNNNKTSCHAHVKQCPLNPNKGNYFVDRAGYEKAHRLRQIVQIQGALQLICPDNWKHDPVVKEAIDDASKVLRSSGLSPSDVTSLVQAPLRQIPAVRNPLENPVMLVLAVVLLGICVCFNRLFWSLCYRLLTALPGLFGTCVMYSMNLLVVMKFVWVTSWSIIAFCWSIYFTSLKALPRLFGTCVIYSINLLASVCVAVEPVLKLALLASWSIITSCWSIYITVLKALPRLLFGIA